LPEERFTSASCQFTLGGTLVELSHADAELEVEGRRLSVPIQVVGDTSHAQGSKVRVRFYRGQPILIYGPEVQIDAKNSPAKRASDYQNSAIGVFALSTGLIGLGLLIGWFQKITHG
jgi:hypothetical protein